MGDKVNDLPRLDKAQRDVVMLGIATAAIILFVGIGGTVMPQVARHWLDSSAAPFSRTSHSVSSPSNTSATPSPASSSAVTSKPQRYSQSARSIHCSRGSASR